MKCFHLNQIKLGLNHLLRYRTAIQRKQLIIRCAHSRTDDRKNAYSIKAAYINHAFLPYFIFPILFAKESDDDKKQIKRSLQFNFIADVVQEVIPSIVQIELKQNNLFGLGSSKSNGSGFIISSDGLILTNAHVVRDEHSELNIKLHNGKTYRGRVIKIDKLADLALIQIDCVSFFIFFAYLNFLA
jgi:S1-C subfamily serine protease